MSLYLTNNSNATDSFKLNLTNITGMTLDTFNLTMNITQGNYTWNVFSCDTLNNCGFAPNNRTIEIRPFAPVSVTCDCPSINTNWIIDDGSICTLDADCYIGTGILRVIWGLLNIPNGFTFNGAGCFADPPLGGIFTETGGTRLCGQT